MVVCAATWCVLVCCASADDACLESFGDIFKFDASHKYLNLLALCCHLTRVGGLHHCLFVYMVVISSGCSSNKVFVLISSVVKTHFVLFRTFC